MGKLVFRVKAQTDQESRIKNIRETATKLWPATQISVDWVGKTANVTVTAVPDSFHGDRIALAFGQDAIFREWNEKPTEGAIPVE